MIGERSQRRLARSNKTADDAARNARFYFIVDFNIHGHLGDNNIIMSGSVHLSRYLMGQRDESNTVVKSDFK